MASNASAAACCRPSAMRTSPAGTELRDTGDRDVDAAQLLLGRRRAAEPLGSRHQARLDDVQTVEEAGELGAGAQREPDAALAVLGRALLPALGVHVRGALGQH